LTALAPKQLAHLRGRSHRELGGVDHEAMFRATFETVPVAISHTRPSDGGWLRMNPALCKMLDYTAKELTLLSWRDLTHPEDIAADLSQYDRMTSGEIDSYKLIKRYIRKGGSLIWARVSISLIDDNVSEPYVLAVAEDITASVEDQRALQESEERYRTLVDMSPDAIVVIADHRVVYGNASAERLFGAGSADRLLGAESKQLINPSRFDSLSETVAAALESREPTDLTGDHLRRLDGAAICAELQLVIVPVSFESEPATQIIIRDVTEQKRAEERLRYQATHDVRNF
jgi:PAS domain S-box-containing protein